MKASNIAETAERKSLPGSTNEARHEHRNCGVTFARSEASTVRIVEGSNRRCRGGGELKGVSLVGGATVAWPLRPSLRRRRSLVAAMAANTPAAAPVAAITAT
jgi:hypothetical protein